MCIEKVFIDKTLSRRQIMDKYSIPHTTASAVKKRGYLSIRTKSINIEEKKFNLELATRAAEFIYYTKMRNWLQGSRHLKNDLMQEAVSRSFELSGQINGGNVFNFYCQVATNAMWNYLNKEHIIGTWKGREVSFEENVLGHGVYC